MLKQRIVVVSVVAALAAGVGVASAFADEQPAGTATVVVANNDARLADEQGAANDVADAANGVQDEANNAGADDEVGDQQGPDDQSGELGDSNGGDQVDSAGVDAVPAGENG